MSAIIEAIILGIVQGLTEFLPVSSSGHLELAKFILGDDKIGEESLMMTVVLHFATALSTIVVFRNEVAQIIRGLFRPTINDEHRFAINIVVSMIPAVIVGLVFEEEIEALFSQRLVMVGLFLIITGILLFFADRAKTSSKDVSTKNALMIGLAQAFAILPGISRSGATISASVLLKVDREKAARFSFLMVVPLIFGKIAKDLISGELSYSDGISFSMIAGFIASFITGVVACKLMIRLVKKSQLKYFSYYCFVVGSFAILWMLLNS